MSHEPPASAGPRPSDPDDPSAYGSTGNGTPTARARPQAGPPRADAQPRSAPETEPGARALVNMRWHGVAGWAVTTGFCIYFAVGMTVLTVVLAIVAGEIGTAAMTLVPALVFGLLSWPLVKMAPRYSTNQRLSADGTGITLLQETKRSFPGRETRVPWSQVRRYSQDVAVVNSVNGRTKQYSIDIELQDPLSDATLPTWARSDGDKIRIRSNRKKNAEIIRALRMIRSDLYSGD